MTQVSALSTLAWQLAALAHKSRKRSGLKTRSTTLAAYVAGPVLLASAGLAGSALALAALSDAARGWAAALFGLGPGHRS